MRRAFPALTAIVLAVSAARANEVSFGYDLMEAKRMSARSGLPVMAFFLNGVNTSAGVWKYNTFKYPKVIEVSRRFVPVLLPGSSPLAHDFKVFGTVGFVFINAKGDVFHKMDNYNRDPAAFAEDLEKIADENERSLVESLKSDMTSGKPAVAAAAAAAMAQMRGPDAEKVLLDSMGQEIPDSARKVVIDALGKRKVGAAEIVPFLTHKTMVVRSAAVSALAAMGPAGADAAFEGMNSDDADMRVAAQKIVAAVTRYSKPQTAAFWKSGPADERAAALATWKEWWDKNRPGKKTGVSTAKI